MKRVVVLLVGVLALSFAADSNAQRKRRTPPPGQQKPRSKKRNGRAKAPTPPPLASHYDELALSPNVVRQLQRTL